MSNFWVVVADASKARFFRGTSPNRELEEWHDMVNEEARRDELDLVTDKQGRFQDDSAKGGSVHRSSAEPSARDQAVVSFAKEVGKFIEKQRHQGKFEHISLIAEPKVLGLLRETFSKATKEKVLEEVKKNLTKADEETIRDSLSRLTGGFK